MSEKSNSKYEIIAKYVKDISFEIPTPEAYVEAAQNLGSYVTKIDFKSNPYKGSLIELNCKLIIEAPENVKNKIRSEIVMAIVFKITDTSLKQEEVKKMILVTIPYEYFDFFKDFFWEGCFTKY